MTNIHEYTHGLIHSYVIGDALRTYGDAFGLDAVNDDALRYACILADEWSGKHNIPDDEIIDLPDYDDTEGVDDSTLEGLVDLIALEISYY